MLEPFGSSSAASHASTSSSAVGGVASGGGALAGLVGGKLAVNGRGIVTGVSCTPPSDPRLPVLVLYVGGSVDDNENERVRLVVEIFLGGIWVGVGSLVCQLWGVFRGMIPSNVGRNQMTEA
jgi:hypothetical protein